MIIKCLCVLFGFVLNDGLLFAVGFVYCIQMDIVIMIYLNILYLNDWIDLLVYPSICMISQILIMVLD